MTCQHEGHDQDCRETECPSCSEITPAPDQHTCDDMAWERFKPQPIGFVTVNLSADVSAFLDVIHHPERKP